MSYVAGYLARTAQTYTTTLSPLPLARSLSLGHTISQYPPKRFGTHLAIMRYFVIALNAIFSLCLPMLALKMIAFSSQWNSEILAFSGTVNVKGCAHVTFARSSFLVWGI
jgi:hypothetical protein